MPSETECIKTLREIRWEGCVKCPFCDSKDIIKKGWYKKKGHKYQKYQCKNCEGYFNDLTGTIFHDSQVLLKGWFFAAFLMQLGTSTLKISKMLSVTYPTAHKMAKKLRECIYTKRIQKKLKGEVEMDETYVKAGSKGMKVKNRPARKRGSRPRGRGTYAKDTPPVIGILERGSCGVIIEPALDVTNDTLREVVYGKIEKGSIVYTDEFPSYNFLDKDFSHYRVDHGAKIYAIGEIHVNTIEAEFSVFKPWIKTYRGVNKKYLHLYCAHYNFLRNTRDLSWVEQLKEIIIFLRFNFYLDFIDFYDAKSIVN